MIPLLEQWEWEKVNQITCEIGQSRDITGMRRDFLTLLGQLVAFDLADFYLNDTATLGRVRLVDPVVVSRFSKQFNEKFMAEYDKCYGQIDYVKWVFSSHESIVYRESDLINNEMRTKSAFFLDYLKPAGFLHVAGISIAKEGSCISAITLYRTEKRGDFTDKELYILKQLLPHLQSKLSQEFNVVDYNIEKIRKGFSLLAYQYHLSNREIEILKLVCSGHNNSEVGNQLSISVNTVKKHMSNIFDKLGVDSRTHLFNLLLRNNKELFE